MKTIIKIAIVIAIVALPLVFWGNIQSVIKPERTDRARQVDDIEEEKGDKMNKKEKKDKKKKKGLK
jgi:hypothetical protein